MLIELIYVVFPQFKAEKKKKFNIKCIIKPVSRSRTNESRVRFRNMQNWHTLKKVKKNIAKNRCTILVHIYLNIYSGSCRPFLFFYIFFLVCQQCVSICVLSREKNSLTAVKIFKNVQVYTQKVWLKWDMKKCGSVWYLKCSKKKNSLRSWALQLLQGKWRTLPLKIAENTWVPNVTHWKTLIIAKRTLQTSVELSFWFKGDPLSYLHSLATLRDVSCVVCPAIVILALLS